MMDVRRTLEILSAHRTDEVVIGTMTSGREWASISRNQAMDWPLTGCMGKASSLGLGVALAQPDKRVIVLDGDGSLLMNLGTLVTIGNQAPRNLVHFMLDNGVYETTGGQPVPGSRAVDFGAMALAAGYKHAYLFDDLAKFEAAIERVLHEDGPTFATLRVTQWGQQRGAAPRRTTLQATHELKAALAAR